MSAMREEIPTLTGVRAYAAVWVMVLHLPFSIGVMPHVQLGAIAQHGAWGVDIFFVLSGFILSLLYVPRFQSAGLAAVYRNYLAARFARIYPLHLITLGALAAYFFLNTVMTHERLPPGFTLRPLAANALLLHGWGYVSRLTWNYPSWSISCEWFAYLLLTPAFAFGLRRLGPWTCLALGFVAWTLLYAALHGNGQAIHEQTVSWGVPRITAEFLLGYALFRVYERVRLAPKVADALIAAGIGGIAALCFLPARAEWWLGPAVAALIFGLSSAGPIGRALFANRWAVFWGERSYSIYMLHAVVQIFSNLALEHLGMTNLAPAGGWALFAGLSALVLAGSHVAYERIEVPMRQRLRKLLERREQPRVDAAAAESPA